MSDVILDLDPPVRMSRTHLVLRLLIAASFGILVHAVGWPGGLIYFGIPALAAIRISQLGSARYLAEDTRHWDRIGTWLFGFAAYMALVTDRVPRDAAGGDVRFESHPEGAPRTGSAVLRVLTSIPAVLYLAILGWLASIAWVIAAIAILLVARVPRSIFDFQCAILRCHARWLGYHASLTDRYPPFRLDLGPDHVRTANAA